MSREDNAFTIPNILSMFRLLLIPVYATLYLTANSVKQYVWAAAILALSTITDFFDGIIARKCNMISKLGTALDPFADKATQGVLIVCLCIRRGTLALWLLLALFVIKEGFMLIMALINLKRGKMLKGAVFAGKLSTAVLFISMIALVLFYKIPETAVNCIVVFCAMFMIISFIAYINAFRNADEHMQNVDPKTDLFYQKQK